MRRGLLSSRSNLMARILASGLERPEGTLAMKNVHAWACLSEATGRPMDAQDLLSSVAALNRNETLFTLARIASALANADGGALGPEARSWTHDLLGQRQDSANGEEAA